MVRSKPVSIDKPSLTLPQQAMAPITPLEPGMDMFERGKAHSFFSPALAVRSSLGRPLSHISVAYTDIEDDEDDNSSEFEEYSASSVRLILPLMAPRLTRLRATTGGVRQPYPPSKRCEHQVTSCDHSMPIGTCQSRSKAPKAHICSAPHSAPMTSHMTMHSKCRLCYPRTPRPDFRPRSENPPPKLWFPRESTITSRWR